MISALLVSATCLLPASSGVDDLIASLEALAQDKAERIKQLAAQANQAKARGDVDEERRLRAEGYGLAADYYFNDKGDRAKAEQAYARAKSYGWTEAPPWGDDAPTPTPTRTPRPTATPKPTPKPKPRVDPRTGKSDPWPYYELNPLKTGRNATWHSTLGIPPMEAATQIPKKSWDFRVGLELQSSDFAVTVNGETTLYHTDRHEEIFELNYGITETLVVGGRLTLGELLQVDDDVIRIFEGGTQIIPTGDRSFALGELVLRAKYVPDWGDFEFARVGGLVEIKLPLADSAAIFTSGTLDISMTGLLTIPIGELPLLGDAEIHVNAGPVMPVGSAALFDPEFDPNMFFTYAFGGAVKLHARLTGIMQVEGNTSGWTDIGVLGDPIMRMTLGGRWKIGQKAFMSGALGTGMDEISGAILFSLSFDFAF